MKVTPLEIPDVLLIEPKVFGDERGFFLESYNKQRFNEALDKDITFVQDNHSLSSKGVLRGLHYQIQNAQAKLVRVISGEIFDVAVDIRRGSPTFGKWVGEVLSGANKRQMWVPAGFAHGFVTLSDTAEVLYKASDYYYPAHERSIKWNDPEINITWPIDYQPNLSAKDAQAVSFREAEVY